MQQNVYTSSAEPRNSHEYLPHRLDLPQILLAVSPFPSRRSRHSTVELEYNFNFDVCVGCISRRGRAMLMIISLSCTNPCFNAIVLKKFNDLKLFPGLKQQLPFVKHVQYAVQISNVRRLKQSPCFYLIFQVSEERCWFQS